MGIVREKRREQKEKSVELEAEEGVSEGLLLPLEF